METQAYFTLVGKVYIEVFSLEGNSAVLGETNIKYAFG